MLSDRLPGKAVLFPNPFTSRACDIFNCQNRSLWFVGDPNGPHSVTFMLCEPCAKNLIHKAPAKLRDGGPELTEQVKAEFEKEKGIYFAQEFQRRAHDVLVHEQAEYLRTRERLEQEARERLRDELVGALTPKGKAEELPFTDLEEDEKPGEKAVFRCLDCDAEFDTKRALSNHMRIHKE